MQLRSAKFWKTHDFALVFFNSARGKGNNVTFDSAQAPPLITTLAGYVTPHGYKNSNPSPKPGTFPCHEITQIAHPPFPIRTIPVTVVIEVLGPRVRLGCRLKIQKAAVGRAEALRWRARGIDLIRSGRLGPEAMFRCSEGID